MKDLGMHMRGEADNPICRHAEAPSPRTKSPAPRWSPFSSPLPKARRHRFFVPALPFLATALVSAGTFEYDAGPCPDAALSVAKFRIRTPAGDGPLRGTLILLGGRNSDARTMADDPAWWALATETRLALMAGFLKGAGNDHETYQLDESGATARLLNRAIEALGDASKHPDIGKLPLAFWGTSAGGNVGVAYAWHFPERTICVAAIVAPNGHGPPTAKKIKVPILAIIGKNDRPEWITYAMECYDSVRGGKVPWTLAFHERRGHSGAGSQDLARTFLRTTIAQRLDIAPDAQPSPPAPLDLQKGWLGDLETYAIAPYSEFDGNMKNATWLPDKATASAWQEYLRAP